MNSLWADVRRCQSGCSVGYIWNYQQQYYRLNVRLNPQRHPQADHWEVNSGTQRLPPAVYKGHHQIGVNKVIFQNWILILNKKFFAELHNRGKIHHVYLSWAWTKNAISLSFFFHIHPSLYHTHTHTHTHIHTQEHSAMHHKCIIRVQAVVQQLPRIHAFWLHSNRVGT